MRITFKVYLLVCFLSISNNIFSQGSVQKKGTRSGLNASNNSGMGQFAFFNLSTENSNPGIGTGALRNSSVRTGNTAVGMSAINSNTSITNNVAVGQAALFALVNSDPLFGQAYGDNVALGRRALRYLIDGNQNTAIGNEALKDLIFGSNNIGLGFNAQIPGGSGSPGAFVRNQLSIQNVIYGINMSSASNANLSIGVTGGPIGVTAGGIMPAGTIAKLHIGSNGATMPSLRLDYVPNGTNETNKFLFLDSKGIVSQASVSALMNGINTCTTAGYLPAVTNSGGSGNMGCSQVWDNGSTGVGIGTTTGMTYITGTAASIYDNGYTGTNTTVLPNSTAFRLVVNGYTSASAYIALSDENLKKEIKQIENPIQKLSQLNGYTYFWNTENKQGRTLDKSRQSGFLAQEVLKVLPEAVVKADDGIYGVNYNAIMPLLTEAIKSQQLQIENLKDQVRDLSNTVNRLAPGEIIVKPELFTITPNPVTESAIISINNSDLPSGSYIGIFDLQGKLIKKIILTNKTSKITLSKNEYSNGMYIVSLISNNIEKQSKRVVISN